MAVKYSSEERIEMFSLLKRGCNCVETATVLNILYGNGRTKNSVATQKQFADDNILDAIRKNGFNLSDKCYKETIKCAVNAGYL